MEGRIYIAIDLKSFYASVECVERGLDPMTTNLVVADPRRTEKTICLAVSPSLKAYGIGGRARLFEVVQRVREVNRERRRRAPGNRFAEKSFDAKKLERFPELMLDYIVAPPQMAHYMEVSTRIYQVYLRYIAPEDIHVYSIDEVFIDATEYLNTYGLNARELAVKLIMEVLKETGITAAAGIGTNLYLCKVAMDIGAKHAVPDENGVRAAYLDEQTYRRQLWDHRPLTDFWRVGRGTAEKLEKQGIYTMGDIARCSVGGPADHYNEDLLYRLFGVNAELLIDHAWGWEPCTIKDIRAYRPKSSSIGSGQVLPCAVSADQARLIVREMADLLALDLVDKRMMSDQLVMTVGYDISSLEEKGGTYRGAVTTDPYGRKIPKHAHGTENLEHFTSSSVEFMEGFTRLYDRIINRKLLVRRLYLTANHAIGEEEAKEKEKQAYRQLDLFTDYAEEEKREKKRNAELERERKLQEVSLAIKKKFGKNAILKGMNLQEGATARERNEQIGGHKA